MPIQKQYNSHNNSWMLYVNMPENKKTHRTKEKEK